MSDSGDRDLRSRIIQKVSQLPVSSLPLIDCYLDVVCQAAGIIVESQSTPLPDMFRIGAPQSTKSWPHAPLHRLTEKGAYFVTGATLHRQHIFRSKLLLDDLEAKLLGTAEKHGWQLEAWAVFSNHYHFIAQNMGAASELKEMIGELHSTSAHVANETDRKLGRQVWFNYWDMRLTFENSYFARLNYVHQNPVKHGLVEVANLYPWCSAAWFERTARPAQISTIYGFKTDRVKVLDEFEPVKPE